MLFLSSSFFIVNTVMKVYEFLFLCFEDIILMETQFRSPVIFSRVSPASPGGPEFVFSTCKAEWSRKAFLQVRVSGSLRLAMTRIWVRLSAIWNENERGMRRGLNQTPTVHRLSWPLCSNDLAECSHFWVAQQHLYFQHSPLPSPISSIRLLSWVLFPTPMIQSPRVLLTFQLGYLIDVLNLHAQNMNSQLPSVLTCTGVFPTPNPCCELPWPKNWDSPLIPLFLSNPTPTSSASSPGYLQNTTSFYHLGCCHSSWSHHRLSRALPRRPPHYSTCFHPGPTKVYLPLSSQRNALKCKADESFLLFKPSYGSTYQVAQTPKPLWWF